MNVKELKQTIREETAKGQVYRPVEFCLNKISEFEAGIRKRIEEIENGLITYVGVRNQAHPKDILLFELSRLLGDEEVSG